MFHLTKFMDNKLDLEPHRLVIDVRNGPLQAPVLVPVVARLFPFLLEGDVKQALLQVAVLRGYVLRGSQQLRAPDTGRQEDVVVLAHEVQWVGQVRGPGPRAERLNAGGVRAVFGADGSWEDPVEVLGVGLVHVDEFLHVVGGEGAELFLEHRHEPPPCPTFVVVGRPVEGDGLAPGAEREEDVRGGLGLGVKVQLLQLGQVQRRPEIVEHEQRRDPVLAPVPGLLVERMRNHLTPLDRQAS
ncbi:hypothetical protein PG985_010513 [Apiospora marii]|uniref:Uncharacterized protein n=1 Tax=Apiospora marii TaxID=335849 RepID=A0ABR1T2X7_9PEZI